MAVHGRTAGCGDSTLTTMSRHWKRTVIAGVVVALSGAMLAGPVSAAHEPARLGLTPVGEEGTYFEIVMAAGETRDLRVEAANFGHEGAVAQTYAANVYSIVNGGFGASLFGEEPTGTTEWVNFPTQEFNLGPGDAVVIDVRITVPQDTRPGEYIAALVIENAEPVRGAGTIAVDQVNRSAIAIAIDVPGARQPALTIGEVSHSEVAAGSVLTFEIDNPGNVHLQPAGEFVLRDEAGQQITSASPQMDSVYAGTSALLEVSVGDLLAPGEYCGELALSDADTGVRASTACLPFTVVASGTGTAPADGLPSVTQVVGALGGSTIVVPLLIAAFGVGTVGVVFAARRRRSASSAKGGPSDSWPVADTDVRRPGGPEAFSRAVATLRRSLQARQRIARAWIIERDSAFMLAIEGTAGTTPAEAARLAAEVQESADRELRLVMPVRVMYLQGDGPVSRMTADAAPFYVRRRST